MKKTGFGSVFYIGFVVAKSIPRWGNIEMWEIRDRIEDSGATCYQ